MKGPLIISLSRIDFPITALLEVIKGKILALLLVEVETYKEVKGGKV